jgi:hypothetical protein
VIKYEKYSGGMEMKTEYLMTFVQNSKGLFDVKKDESDLQCLTHYYLFPAKFVFNDGEELIAWLNHTYSYNQEKHAIIHTLYSTTLWFELHVKVDGSLSGKLRKRESRATMWMTSHWNSYYYDKFGEQEHVNVYDDEGEDLPDNPGTCTSCGYEFRLTNDFENGKCSACNRYDNNEKQVPDLNSSEWKWDVPAEEEENLQKESSIV